MYASKNDHPSVVEVLIEYNANIDSQDLDGETALMLASTYGHEEVVRLLIDANANVNISDLETNTTALMYSALCIQIQPDAILSYLCIIEQLLCADADITAQNIFQDTFIDCAPEEYRNQIQELIELSNVYQRRRLK
jgi:serine/threonine-protein phosphatase 6 regulatory ankyrin repeat subunit B